MKKTIIYIDDEVIESGPYRDELSREFNIVYLSSSDGGQDLIDQVVTIGPVALVQDIMLRTKDADNIDNNWGIKILRSIKETMITLKIPTLVFTNRISRDLEDAVHELEFPPRLIGLHFKPETGLKDLTREVKRLIDGIEKKLS